jgi:DNA-binding transcriptional ArsR family regulator
VLRSLGTTSARANSPGPFHTTRCVSGVLRPYPNQVAERAGISQSAASQQLALLRRGGIVTSRRDGKEVLYRGDRDGVARILGDLQNYLKFC